MYKVGLTTAPEDGESIWTLGIDYHAPEKEYPLVNHGEQISVHGASLSICLFKAKIICDVLNCNDLAIVEILINLLEVSKVTAKELQDIQDEHNAKSDS